MPTFATSLTSNKALIDWVGQMVVLCSPDQIVWCDGSEDERKRLTDFAVSKGILTPLNAEKHPNS